MEPEPEPGKPRYIPPVRPEPQRIVAIFYGGEQDGEMREIALTSSGDLPEYINVPVPVTPSEIYNSSPHDPVRSTEVNFQTYRLRDEQPSNAAPEYELVSPEPPPKSGAVGLWQINDEVQWHELDSSPLTKSPLPKRPRNREDWKVSAELIDKMKQNQNSIQFDFDWAPSSEETRNFLREIMDEFIRDQNIQDLFNRRHGEDV